MLSLAEFLAQAPPEPTAPAGPPVAAGRPPAAIVEAALTFAGLRSDEAQAVVVVGTPGPGVLEALLAACDGAAVLLVAAGATPGRPHPSLPPGFDPRLHEGVFVADLPAAGGPGLDVKVVSELVQFCSSAELAPSQVVLLPPTAEADPEWATFLVVQDFVRGHSTRLLAELPAHGAAAGPLLRGIADFLFGCRDLYHALKYYWAVYHAGPEAQAGWRILECWAELGCAEWVARWVTEPIFSDEFRDKILAEVGPDLEATGGFRRECFRHNRDALAQRPGASPALVDQLVEPDGRAIALVHVPSVPWRLGYDGKQLALGRDDYPLLLRTGGPTLVELNPPPDLAEYHALTASVQSRDQPHAAVVGWVRHAWSAQMLLSTKVAQPLPGWVRLIFLLEPDAEALSALLGTVDLSRQLSAEGVRPFVGPDATLRFVAALHADADIPPPGTLIGASAALADELRATGSIRVTAAVSNKQRLDRELGAAHLRETLAVLEAHAAGRPARPLRGLIATSLYSDVVQHVSLDLAAGFRRVGHECTVLRESQPGHMVHYQSLTAKLLELRPDFVVLINHTRAEAFQFHPTHVPYVTWVQDELPALKDRSLIAMLGPFDFAYGFSVPVRDAFRAAGYPFVGHLPFAVSDDAFSEGLPERCRDEVIFATHVTDPVLPPFLHIHLTRWLTASMPKWGKFPLSLPWLAMKIDQEAPPRFGNLARLSEAERSEALFYCLMTARTYLRVRIADALLAAQLPFAVYGRGWDRLPRFAAHHRGLVAPGEPLRKVLRESKVVLHVNQGCNVHPRLLEGFAAGGFVIAQHDASDDLPGETASQFAIGRELFLFHDDDEMVALIRRAMTDEPWRRGVIEAARARLRASHTYASRAQVVLEDLRAGISRHLAGGAGAKAPP